MNRRGYSILGTKRFVCFLAAFYVGGILVSQKSAVFWVIYFVYIFILLVFYLNHFSKKKMAVLAMLLISGAAFCSYGRAEAQDSRYQKGLEWARDGMSATLSGRVIGKEEKDGISLYYLEQVLCKDGFSAVDRTSSAHKYQKIILYYKNDSIPIGTVLETEGDISFFAGAANEGGFDPSAYYRLMDISFSVKAERILSADLPQCSVGENLYQIKKSWLAVFQKQLNSKDAGLMSAMVLGEKSALEADSRQMYQLHGVSHILVISGLHISFAGLLIFGLSRRLRLGFLPASVLSGTAVFLFALMSGFGISAERAVIMFFCMLAAGITGRKHDPFQSLCMSALWILFRNPFALFHSGFLLSYASVLSIVLLKPVLDIPILGIVGKMGLDAHAPENRESRKRDSPSEAELSTAAMFIFTAVRPIAEHILFFLLNIKRTKLLGKLVRKNLMNLSLNLAVQIGMVPLTAYFFFEIPVYGIVLNLFIVPLSSLLLLLGFGGAVIGNLFPLFSEKLLVLCHCILFLFEKMMSINDRLPAASMITGQPSFAIIAIYYTLAGVFFFLAWLLRWHLMCICPLMFFLAWVFHPVNEPFQIDFLDVGQGDGICITVGDGKHYFIDGGSSSAKEVGMRRILPFLKYRKIKKIDAWIVTHTDSDHISGLEEALESGYRIENLIAAKAIEGNGEWKELKLIAETAGSNILYVSEGGLIRGKGVTLECLYPKATDTSEDMNELCQVWELDKQGIRMLFMADIGFGIEEVLIQRNLLHDVDLLKVGHHGSKNSSSEAFLAKVNPEVSVISVGEKNMYGHPHADTLKRLSEINSRIFMTKDGGQVAVRLSGQRMYIGRPAG